MNQWEWLARGFAELGYPCGVIAGTHKEMEDVTRCLPDGDNRDSAGQGVASEPLQPAIIRRDIADVQVPASAGGEVSIPVLSSPLQQFGESRSLTHCCADGDCSSKGKQATPYNGSINLQEVTPMRDEPPVAIQEAEKRPDNMHIDVKLTYENPGICERQGGVEGRPIEAPPFDGTTIIRLMDAVERCEERSRR